MRAQRLICATFTCIFISIGYGPSRPETFYHHFFAGPPPPHDHAAADDDTGSDDGDNGDSGDNATDEDVPAAKPHAGTAYARRAADQPAFVPRPVPAGKATAAAAAAAAAAAVKPVTKAWNKYKSTYRHAGFVASAVLRVSEEREVGSYDATEKERLIEHVIKHCQAPLLVRPL